MSGIMQTLLAAGSVNDAQLVAQNSGTASTPTPASLGAVAGDLAAVVTTNASVSSAGAGTWTVINSAASRGALYWKQLVTGDLGSPILLSGGFTDYTLVIVRGAASIVEVLTASATAHSATTSGGFTRNTNHAGLLGLTVTQSGPDPTLISAPATFITSSLGPFSAGTTYVSSLSFRLAPPSTAYVSGTQFTYGDFQGGVAPTSYLSILELRR